MTSAQPQTARPDVRVNPIAVLATFMFLTVAIPPLQAQSFSVLYSFQNNGQIGFYPTGGVSIDRAGNLYGTTQYGGSTNCYEGCGTAFKLTRHGSSWQLTPLYRFLGIEDGNNPAARLVIGPDGSLFGTTMEGGGPGCMGMGCGTVFQLQPPQRATGNLVHGWSETVLYRFQGGNDGALPELGDLVFDQAGNIYGTTDVGGGSQCAENCGTVFELTHSTGSWIESILHVFGQTGDGDEPYGGVIFDQAGNLYGTASSGGAHHQGAVYELTNSGSGWTEQLLYSFTGGNDGAFPFSGLTIDAAGNLYGNTCCAGSNGYSGTAFELIAAQNYAFDLGYDFGAPGTGQGPQGNFILDSAGNIYGTATTGGAYGFGAIFKLTPSDGGWTYTSVHDFCAGGYPPCADGYTPTGNLAMDSAGNLYGTTSNGGANGGGVVYELTP